MKQLSLASKVTIDEDNLLLAMEDGTVGVLFFTFNEFMGYANKAFQRMSGYSHQELLEGINWETITPPEFREVTHKATAELGEKGETAPYEKQLVRPDGSRWWGLFAPRRISGEGSNSRCVEFIIDITKTKEMEFALRESEARFRFLSEFEEEIRGLKNPAEIMEVATRKTAEHLKASRCAYADVEIDGDHFTIRNDYVADGSVSTAGFYSLATFGSKAVEDLNAGKTLILKDIQQELTVDNGAETFGAIGIKAIITCPLVKEGRLHAMMAVHQNTPRNWTSQEIDLMESIADRLWSHIERVRFDAKMRESERQFRHLANSMPQVVWTTTPDGVVDYVNDRYYQYSGNLGTENGKIKWIPIIHPEDVANTIEAWKYCVATGKPYDIQHRIFHKESNQYRWNLTRAVPIKDEKNEIIKWYGTNVDIQAQREANEDLRKIKEHLELILASATDFAIVSMDVEGCVVSWSKGAERIFRYTAEEMMGKNLAPIFTPEDRIAGTRQTELSMAAKSGRAEDERWHMRKDGSRFYASGILAAMYDDRGAVQGFTKIARDVTAQKQTEQDIIEARNAAEAANIAKTEFLANMSHEIRTPMNAVIGLSSILSMSEPLTDRQREYIKTLQMSADSLLALINDLLDIAKIEARTVELERIPFNLKKPDPGHNKYDQGVRSAKRTEFDF